MAAQPNPPITKICVLVGLGLFNIVASSRKVITQQASAAQPATEINPCFMRSPCSASPALGNSVTSTPYRVAEQLCCTAMSDIPFAAKPDHSYQQCGSASQE